MQLDKNKLGILTDLTDGTTEDPEDCIMTVYSGYTVCCLSPLHNVPFTWP